MLDSLVGSILNGSTELASIGLTDFVICTAVSLMLGAIAACFYMYKTNYTKSFVVTIALLPAVVQLVIMLVNGNLGAGLAVMGAFSLVRFRSIPGSAKDIAAVFIAMAIGLATGMGFLFIAAVFVLIMGAVTIVYGLIPFGEKGQGEKQLRITIPESLDYRGVFDGVFSKYTTSHELLTVKTTNMGSLYQLQYRMRLKNDANEKEFIDDLRTRNGNLEITLGRDLFKREEL